MISEFFGRFNDFIATSNAVVPFDIAIEYLFPTYLEKSCSIFPYGPVV